MKKNMRDFFRQERLSLPESAQMAHETAICQHLLSHKDWPNWQHIAFYWATDGEICLLKSLEAALSAHKHCYLPCLTKEGILQFGAYQEETPVIENKYGILEPQTALFLPASQLDVVLLPLVAFDKQGNRLGMGKGYYDKTFAFKSTKSPNTPLLIGVAHDCQKADNILTDSWDVPLDFILTESGIHKT